MFALSGAKYTRWIYSGNPICGRYRYLLMFTPFLTILCWQVLVTITFACLHSIFEDNTLSGSEGPCFIIFVRWVMTSLTICLVAIPPKISIFFSWRPITTIVCYYFSIINACTLWLLCKPSVCRSIILCKDTALFSCKHLLTQNILHR